jgi:hypothetical protein
VGLRAPAGVTSRADQGPVLPTVPGRGCRTCESGRRSPSGISAQPIILEARSQPLT